MSKNSNRIILKLLLTKKRAVNVVVCILKLNNLINDKKLKTAINRFFTLCRWIKMIACFTGPIDDISKFYNFALTICNRKFFSPRLNLNSMRNSYTSNFSV